MPRRVTLGLPRPAMPTSHDFPSIGYAYYSALGIGGDG